MQDFKEFIEICDPTENKLIRKICDNLEIRGTNKDESAKYLELIVAVLHEYHEWTNDADA